MKKIFFFSVFMIVLSCKKQDSWYVNTHVYNATLKAYVYVQIDSVGFSEKIPLRYAIISLYKSDFDRETHQNSISTNQTDANGYAPFFHLTDGYYYVSIWHYLYGYQT